MLMQTWIRFIVKKNIVKVFIGSAASSVIKIVTTIILSKIIAEKLGPAGLGMVGQLTSFVAIVLIFASGGFQNGVVTITANKRVTGNLEEFTKPALKLSMIISACCGLILLIFTGTLSHLVFKTREYEFVFYWMGFTIIFYSFNAYFNSFLNGISDYRNFNFLNICNSIFSLIVSAGLTIWMGIKGALIAVVLSQTLTSIAIIPVLIKYKKYYTGFFKPAITKELIKKLLPFFKMTVFSFVLLPVSQIIIRNLILKSEGTFDVGIWEAINRISGLYMMFLLNIMLIYYLPKLSQLKESTAIKQEFKKGALFFGGILCFIGIIVYLLRFFIIRIFLSNSFIPVGDLILPQLTADLFKVIYYLLAYFVIAKSLTRYYILTEMFVFCLYIALAYFLIPLYGVKGAIYCNILAIFSGMIIHIIFIWKLFFSERNWLTNYLFQKKLPE